MKLNYHLFSVVTATLQLLGNSLLSLFAYGNVDSDLQFIQKVTWPLPSNYCSSNLFLMWINTSRLPHNGALPRLQLSYKNDKRVTKRPSSQARTEICGQICTLMLRKAQRACRQKAKQVVRQHVLWGNLSPRTISLQPPHVNKWEKKKKCC